MFEVAVFFLTAFVLSFIASFVVTFFNLKRAENRRVRVYSRLHGITLDHE